MWHLSSSFGGHFFFTSLSFFSSLFSSFSHQKWSRPEPDLMILIPGDSIQPLPSTRTRDPLNPNVFKLSVWRDLSVWGFDRTDSLGYAWNATSTVYAPSVLLLLQKFLFLFLTRLKFKSNICRWILQAGASKTRLWSETHGPLLNDETEHWFGRNWQKLYMWYPMNIDINQQYSHIACIQSTVCIA